jgi:hypothetical protein
MSKFELSKERQYPQGRESKEFVDQLSDLLNRHSKENASNTPDFILAQYLVACLEAWNTATQQRETWYGRDARPSEMPAGKGSA